MTTDPRKRRGDWSVNAELLREEIDATWAVRTHISSQYHDVGNKRRLWVVTAQAVFVPPLVGYPHSINTLVTVDRQYVTPYDRACYMALYQLWVALDALNVPLRQRPQ